jgi:hypothetical protein
VKWIVGFSKPTTNAEKSLSFIPEFIVQASLGYQIGRKNRVLDSIGLSLLAPPLLYHFELFGQHVTFPRFRKFSENRINREKIKSRVKKNRGGQGTAE